MKLVEINGNLLRLVVTINFYLFLSISINFYQFQNYFLAMMLFL